MHPALVVALKAIPDVITPLVIGYLSQKIIGSAGSRDIHNQSVMISGDGFKFEVIIHELSKEIDFEKLLSIAMPESTMLP